MGGVGTNKLLGRRVRDLAGDRRPLSHPFCLVQCPRLRNEGLGRTGPRKISEHRPARCYPCLIFSGSFIQSIDSRREGRYLYRFFGVQPGPFGRAAYGEQPTHLGSARAFLPFSRLRKKSSFNDLSEIVGSSHFVYVFKNCNYEIERGGCCKW